MPFAQAQRLQLPHFMNAPRQPRTQTSVLDAYKRALLALAAALTVTQSPIAGADQNFDIAYRDAGLAKVAELEKLPLAERNAQATKLLQKTLREKFLRRLFADVEKNPEKRLGALKVADLLTRLESVQIDWNLTGKPLQMDPERDSDYYLTGQHLAMLNAISVHKAPPRALIALLFHVIAGAAGFEDEDYQLTLALLLYELTYTPGPVQDFLKTIDFNELFPKTVKDVYRPIDPIAGKGGGFTGLGGGGDATSVAVKLAMIEFAPVLHRFYYDLCDGRWQNRTTYIKDILQLELESSAQVSENSYIRRKDGGFKLIIPQTSIQDSKALEKATLRSMVSLCALKTFRQTDSKN